MITTSRLCEYFRQGERKNHTPVNPDNYRKLFLGVDLRVEDAVEDRQIRVGRSTWITNFKNRQSSDGKKASRFPWPLSWNGAAGAEPGPVM